MKSLVYVALTLALAAGAIGAIELASQEPAALGVGQLDGTTVLTDASELRDESGLTDVAGLGSGGDQPKAASDARAAAPSTTAPPQPQDSSQPTDTSTTAAPTTTTTNAEPPTTEPPTTEPPTTEPAATTTTAPPTTTTTQPPTTTRPPPTTTQPPTTTTAPPPPSGKPTGYQISRLKGYLWGDGKDRGGGEFFFRANSKPVVDHFRKMALAIADDVAEGRSGSYTTFVIKVPGWKGWPSGVPSVPDKKAFAASVIEGEGSRSGKVLDDPTPARVKAFEGLLSSLGIQTTHDETYRHLYARQASWPKFTSFPFVTCNRVPGGKC